MSENNRDERNREVTQPDVEFIVLDDEPDVITDQELLGLFNKARGKTKNLPTTGMVTSLEKQRVWG